MRRNTTSFWVLSPLPVLAFLLSGGDSSGLPLDFSRVVPEPASTLVLITSLVALMFGRRIKRS